MPIGFIAMMPSVQNPMWLTEEYATSFFQSFCMRHSKAPYTIATIERTETTNTTVSLTDALGSNGSENRSNPYVPIFNRMLASTTEPAVGASVCASGSQVWNGNIGTFTAKPRKKAQNTHHCIVSDRLVFISASMLNESELVWRKFW